MATAMETAMVSDQIVKEKVIETKKKLRWRLNDFTTIVKDKDLLEREEAKFEIVHGKEGVKSSWEVWFEFVDLEQDPAQRQNPGVVQWKVMTLDEMLHFDELFSNPFEDNQNNLFMDSETEAETPDKALVVCVGLQKKDDGPSSVEADVYISLEGSNEQIFFSANSEDKSKIVAGDLMSWPVCHVPCAYDFPLDNGTLIVNIHLKIYEKVPQQATEMDRKAQVARKDNLHSLIAHLENSKENSDITLVSCDDHAFFAYRWILADASLVFKAYFKAKKTETSNVTIMKLRKVQGKTLKILLHFIYTGEVLMEWSHQDILSELLHIGVNYHIKELREYLDASMGTICTIQSSQRLLRLAIGYQLKTAEADISAFIKQNAATPVLIQINSDEEFQTTAAAAAAIIGHNQPQQ